MFPFTEQGDSETTHWIGINRTRDHLPREGDFIFNTGYRGGKSRELHPDHRAALDTMSKLIHYRVIAVKECTGLLANDDGYLADDIDRSRIPQVFLRPAEEEWNSRIGK